MEKHIFNSNIDWKLIFTSPFTFFFYLLQYFEENSPLALNVIRGCLLAS